jgi:glycerophosphoryl diester phosphodiesterase
MPDELPLIYAHRGASAHAPENTLAAFALAEQEGADGIELDVHLTADGAIVVLHDDQVDATTNGRGSVDALTLAKVRDLRVRARNSTTFTEERIPTLEEILERFGHGRLDINVEIKPTGQPQLADAVARQIKALGKGDVVLLSSFDRVALAYLQAQHPDLRCALLYPPSMTTGVFTGILGDLSWLTGAHALGCEAVHPFHRLVSPRVVQRAHDLALALNIWTVDDPAIIRKLAALGVDGFITNDPRQARAALISATADK